MYENTMNQQLFTSQYTKILSNIFPTYEDFYNEYKSCGLPFRFTNDSFLKTIYIVLMGEYSNSSIMNFSIDQFKLRFFTRIMSYGPQYERELEMQNKLLQLSDDELQISAKAIYNTALNPSTQPTTDTLDELTTINQQSVTKHKRSLMDAYAILEGLLDDNLTQKFVKRFKDLFVVILRTNDPLYYSTDEGEFDQ